MSAVGGNKRSLPKRVFIRTQWDQALFLLHENIFVYKFLHQSDILIFVKTVEIIKILNRYNLEHSIIGPSQGRQNSIPEINMTKKVLLVDNSKVSLEIEQEFLRETPVKVFTSENGNKAIEFARRLRPDLVYIDLAPPRMDGASCCIAIKEDPDLAGTRVILVASPGEMEITASRIAGCDAFLAKPLDRRQFITVGRSLLSRSNKHEQRVPCRPTVACRSEGTIFYGAIEDLDISGMFVRSHFAVKTGQRLALKFFVPEIGAEVIDTWARVCWVNGGRVRRKPQLPAGFGVEFEALEKQATEQIMEFVERSTLWQKLSGAW
jgi:CheY-like chemotaxis protein